MGRGVKVEGFELPSLTGCFEDVVKGSLDGLLAFQG